VAARGDGSLKEVRLAGASALRLLIGAYIQSDLAQPATFDVFYDSASGANYRAYSFKTKVAVGSWPVGTPVVIYKRDLGGSTQGVAPLLNGGDATQTHMLIDASCTTGSGPSPATDVQKPGFICAGTTAALAHGGFSDVEPPLLQEIVNGGTGLDTSGLDAAGFVQNIFAVAVNKKLYLALQKAQGLVPTSATAIDESAAAQPSLPKTFIAGALTGQILGSSSNKKGWNLLIPASVDSNINNKRVNVCRRTPGSGTQAASNLYFANNPCGGANQYTPTAGSTSATLAVTGSITTLQNSTTQDVENCLFNVEGLADSTGGAYGFSILSLASNPLKTEAGAAVDRGYRFAKISQAAPTKANVIAGNYELSLEIHLNWPRRGFDNSPNDKTEDFLYSMLQKAGRPCMISSSLSLLATPDKSYTSACSPLYGVYDEAPTTYFSWFDNPLRNSISHMQRSNSCAPSRMTK
jgi:hypothetical protein